MSFEEYLDINYNEKLDDLTKFLINDAYKAGAQSRQAEIDAITKQRDSFIKAHHIAMNDVCENKAKIDELQKLRSLDEMEINHLAQANQVWRTKCDELQERIEEALKHVVDHGGYDDLTHVINILKGNKND